MAKLFLTSSGLSNQKITNEFLELFDKKPREIKILFVPTASRTEEERVYVDKSKNQLLDVGILSENIKTLEIDHQISMKEVEDFDVLYVCGGNTFYLLHQIKKYNFDQIIKQFLKTGKVYFGVSAGSYIVCPTIEMALWKNPDKNDVNLIDLTALGLVPFLMTVHYEQKYADSIKKSIMNSMFPVRILTDEQALVIKDDVVKLIGEGKEIELLDKEII